MIAYLVRRLGQAVVVVWLVVTLVFVMLQVQPGSTARAVLGPRAYPAEIAEFNRVNGFDQPTPVQYVRFLASVLHGSLTFAAPHAHTASAIAQGYATGVSLQQLVAGPLANTLLLVVPALVAGVIAGLALGIWLAVGAGPVWVRTSVTLVGQAAYAVPVFALGLFLTQLFAVDVPWLPLNEPEWGLGDVLAQPAALVLPVATLAIGNTALFARYSQASVSECLTADYVAKARAVGASRWRILRHHVARNAAIPVVTVAAARVPVILSVQVPLEAYFHYPGIGNLAWQAATQKDAYTLLGSVLIVGVLVVAATFAADMLYLVLDPRVHYRRRR